jgi:quercetin dioxygenase-like cupin family protein
MLTDSVAGMNSTTTLPKPVLGPAEGNHVQIAALGVRFMVDSAASGGGFSLVEHPIAPRGLGSPLHTHTHEDEYSYVLEGRVGIEIGGETTVAEPGDLVFKPREVPHAFWNAGDEPARLVEIISPGGFEKYFEEIAHLFPADGPPNMEGLPPIAAKYGLRFEEESPERLVRAHNLDFPL